MSVSKPGSNSAYLRRLLKRGGKEFDQRRTAAEEAVVRREFYSEDAINPRPYYHERFEMKRGRRLKQTTAKACEFGFDAKGRVTVVRLPADEEDPASEEFFHYQDHVVESVCYRLGRGSPVLHASLQRFAKGRLIECDVMDVKPPSEFDERYLYKGNWLVEIQSTAIAGASRKTGRWDVQYDAAGRYRCLRRFDEAFDLFFVIHWNPQTAPSIPQLSKAIHRKLVNLIPKVIRRAKKKEPAFCVALAYDFENDPLPPYLGIGTVRERDRWLQEKGKEARAFLWNPAEYARYEDGTLNLVDKRLEEDCEILCQLLLAKFDTWTAQKLLNGVTMELNRHDWSKVLPVTDDFVVYAVDLEGAHLQKNLKAGVPRQKLNLLRKRKLI
jgi:hypothetical protein